MVSRKPLSNDKKILLIPSWYPSKRNSLVGSFFREQASLLQDKGNYDIKVLYGIVKEVNLLAFLTYLFTKFVKKKLPIAQDYLLQEPEYHSFEIKIYRKLTEKQKYFILIRAYAYAYRTLSKTYNWVPDIIHAQSTIDGAIFARNLALSETKTPYMIIEHQVFLLHHFSKYRQALILESIREAKKVGVVSEHQKKMVLMHEPNCKPITIWNYVDEKKFTIAKSSTQRKFTVITVTYPSPIKGYKTFFETLVCLKEKTDDFQYIIIGNASFDDLSKANSTYFENIAKEMGVFEQGIFIPYVEREDLNSLLNSSDVFVSTSIAETFGVAAREAMMCGLPIITTACGGIEDSIAQETGKVVPIYDALAMANILLQIKNKEIIFDAHKIREYVIAQCGTQVFLNNMNNFYD